MWKVRHLVSALLAAGRLEEAVAWSETLLVCTESIYGSGHHLTTEATDFLVRAYREIGELEAAWLLASLALDESVAKGLDSARMEFLRECRETRELPPARTQELERILARLREDPDQDPDPDLSFADCGEFWTVVAEHRARAGAIDAAADAYARSFESIRNPVGPRFFARTARYVLLLCEAGRSDEAEDFLLSLPDPGDEHSLHRRLVLDAGTVVATGYEKTGETKRGIKLGRGFLLPALAREKHLHESRILAIYQWVVDHLRQGREDKELEVFHREVVGSLGARGGQAAAILSRIWTEFAASYCHRGLLDETHRELDRYAAWRESHAVEGDRNGAFRLGMIRAYAFRRGKRFAEGEALLRQAMEEVETWREEDSETPERLREYERAIALEYANLFSDSGDTGKERRWQIRAALLGVPVESFDELEALIGQGEWLGAVEVVTALMDSEGYHQDERLSFADLAGTLAQELAADGERERAERLLRTALGLLAGASPPLPPGRLMVCYQALERVRSGPRDLEGNAAFHAEMVELFTAGPGWDHPATLHLRLRHARILSMAGHSEEALARIEDLAGGEGVQGAPLSNWSLEVRATHGRLLSELGRESEAEAMLLAAWADCETARDDRKGGVGKMLEIRVARNLADHFERNGEIGQGDHWRREVARRENPAAE